MSKARKIYKTEDGGVVYGVMAEFDTPADLFHAAEKVRDADTRADVYSPFPVHGMEEAMGLKSTKLPLLTGIVGLSGPGWGICSSGG